VSDQVWTAAGIAALSMNLGFLWLLEGARGLRKEPKRTESPFVEKTHFAFLVLAILCLTWMWGEPREWVRWSLEGFLVLSLGGFAYGSLKRRKEAARD